MNLIEDSHRIFQAALEEHRPVAVFLLTSGGNDSVVPLHLFRDHPSVTAAVHIDTGIKVPEVEPHVKKTCDALGLKLLVYRALEHTKADGTPDPQDYRDIVMKYGFPGPAQHRIMYAKLKERQIRRLVRDHKTNRSERVMLVTGVRRSESRRRMGTTQEIQRVGGMVWVAPIANWGDLDMQVYRRHYNLPESPVSKKLGMSGECLCGAFATPGEFARLEQHYPEVADYIRRLEQESGCPWRWEERPSRHLIQSDAPGDDDLHLCTSCVARGRAA